MQSKLVIIILAILLTLGGIEVFAWWWMNPPATGAGEPVLAYRPGIADQGSAGVPPAAQESANAQDPSSNPKSTTCHAIADRRRRIHNPQSSISSSPTFTLLPELVSRSIPSLRCSTGTAARIERPDGITVHVAFFEWDRESSTNVLEAFKHLPDECMGSIGMTLVKTHPPRRYEIRGQGAGVRSQETGISSQESEVREQGSGDRGQNSANATAQSASSHSTSNIQHSTSATQSLTFDHTEFRDPAGRPIHAFKGVWVSGSSNLLGPEIRGGGEQWNQLRWQAALKRFRPAHARVAQGAVHGIANPERAWEIFEESMLKDLTFER